MTGPVAAIDCGTNSIRLLIVRPGAAGSPPTELERHLEMVRLGLGVDRTGRFDPVAVERTLDAARRYARLIEHHGVVPADIRFVATSATRDASNRDLFIDGIQQILGVRPEVISGQEEAELSFRGAVATLQGLEEGPRLVVDIGGGSTELVLGAEAPEHRLSLDIGSVRLTERHLLSDPPGPEEVAAAERDIDLALDQAAAVVPWERTSTLIGVAGTVTTVTAVAMGVQEYSPDITHGATMSVAQTRQVCRELLGETRHQRSRHRMIHPGRIDVIGAGALIWDRVVSRVAEAAGITSTRTSEHDILDGIAVDLLERQA